MKEWKVVLQLFWTFMKIGPVTFGGGYAMIPLLEKEIVQKRKWINNKEILDIFAVVESIPGAIAINSATFIGYRVGGGKGAIASLIGIVIPSFTIVVILSLSYQIMKGNPFIDAAFEGIRAAIVALIIYAAIKIGKTAVIDKTTIIIVGITVLVLLFVAVHPVVIILSGIIVGIVISKIRRKKVEGEMEKENTKLKGS